MDWIDLVVRDVCELDYTSPDGSADVMLVTAAELRMILENHAPAADYAERYKLLRRGTYWSVVNGIGDHLTGDALDAAVDAVQAVRAA